MPFNWFSTIDRYISLVHALPALYTVYSDGFMEYTFNVNHSMYILFLYKKQDLDMIKASFSSPNGSEHNELFSNFISSPGRLLEGIDQIVNTVL